MTVGQEFGSLLAGLPAYVSDPPIEAVCFVFGVSEDGQLVRLKSPHSKAISGASSSAAGLFFFNSHAFHSFPPLLLTPQTNFPSLIQIYRV